MKLELLAASVTDRGFSIYVGSPEIREWIEDLPERDQDDIDAALAYVTEHGPPKHTSNAVAHW